MPGRANLGRGAVDALRLWDTVDSGVNGLLRPLVRRALRAAAIAGNAAHTAACAVYRWDRNGGWADRFESFHRQRVYPLVPCAWAGAPDGTAVRMGCPVEDCGAEAAAPMRAYSRARSSAVIRCLHSTTAAAQTIV